MNSPTEQHLGAAFRDLVAEQPFTPDVQGRRQRDRRSAGAPGSTVGGIGAGVVAVGRWRQSRRRRRPSHRPERRTPAQAPRVPPARSASCIGTPTGRAGARPPLVELADVLVAAPRPGGDATLVERETGTPGKASVNVWDLYADDGQYFFSQTKATCQAQVKKDNNQGDGMFGREVAAATAAATGDLDTAVLKMAWALDTTPVPAWLSAQVKTMSAGGVQIDNYVWENSEDALVAGSGNPQVRAGVLRLVSALPGITVTHGTVDGQPTLTLTAGKAELGTVGIDKADPKVETGPAYQEAITINADTGIPLQIASGPAGKVTVTSATW